MEIGGWTETGTELGVDVVAEEAAAVDEAAVEEAAAEEAVAEVDI